MIGIAEIRERLRIAPPDLRQRYPIRSLAVFGSYVRNEQTDASDLDILLDYERPMSFFTLARLRRELETITGLKVDLVLKTTLKARIGARILAEALPV